MDRLFSVIIPVYKVEEWLDRCVESVVGQSYENIEIILVDDGSPDRCPQMCDEWEKKDPRIRVIHKKNGGLSDARNCGIREAKGEYLLFVDSDDYIDKYAVEKFNDYVVDEDLIVAEATIFEGGKIIHRVHTNLEENHLYTGGEVACMAISKGEWFAAACYNLYKRDFLVDNDLFFKIGILHEDNEYQIRLFLKAQKVKYLHNEFYKYVIREGSICSAHTQKNMDDLLITFSEWKKLNETISDNKLKKHYAGALCKSFIHTCREYELGYNIFPEGINRKYLIENALNKKELLKTVCFLLFRKIYVRL